MSRQGGELLAGMSDGQILHSNDHGESWSLGVCTAPILAMAACLGD